VVKYTAKVLIPFILVGVDALLFFPLIGVRGIYFGVNDYYYYNLQIMMFDGVVKSPIYGVAGF